MDKYKDLSSIYEKKKGSDNKPLVEINTYITKTAIERMDELVKKFRDVQKNIIKIFELRK